MTCEKLCVGQVTCWNADVLTQYVTQSTELGSVACAGAIINPVAGNICTATIDGKAVCGETEVAIGTNKLVGDVVVPGFRTVSRGNAAAA